ncbi:MAG TPA: biotin/lipoyl-binding protein, partial [Deltaproteobacteria bacterium]|nr:biotin/lipoyl-binding protein [Deltaproteobacteria bacterium]
MTGKKRSWAVCVPLCLLVLVGMAGCGGGGGEAPVKRARVTGVTVQAASPREIDDLFEAAGTVKSDSASILASRVMGAVTSLKVREGDSVKVGELLEAIDDRDASERAKAASLAMEAA